MNPSPLIPETPPAGEPWRGWYEDLYNGAPGILLWHAARAHADEASWETVHSWATAITRRRLTSDTVAGGLHRGVAAVAYALHAAGDPSYEPVLNTLDHLVVNLTRNRLRHAYERLAAGQLPQLREFDLIRGLTGLGAYLLARRTSTTIEALLGVLDYLVRLTELRTIDDLPLPGWWSSDPPSGLSPADADGGHGNFGLAHGISGPLALLSLSARREIVVDAHLDAIHRIYAWLDDQTCGSGDLVWWPEYVTVAAPALPTKPGRPSWCYGTPGIARAMQLAGIAVGEQAWQRRAAQAMAACATDERQRTLIRDAGICHGWAGLVHTVRHMTADGAALATVLPDLRSRLERQLQREPPVDDGLLTGTSGIQLVLNNRAAAPAWDSCLLLDSATRPMERTP
ncbi:lanthionine synthetase C family protein [Fodinicola acaciae]|uniref:lanthionine synthetase C family protein n=1 Tax=Fodinicola acaciae TaxID=2681555 RepID=UPI0013CFD55B|nr:lanthionine synthetase C family protein [Fodinicola acaciae]